jgi:hypothetical protein
VFCSPAKNSHDSPGKALVLNWLKNSTRKIFPGIAESSEYLYKLGKLF